MVRFCPSTSPSRRSSSKNAWYSRRLMGSLPVSLMAAMGPAGTTIAIRCCFAGSCARADGSAREQQTDREIAPPHSITSSARASANGGIVRPSAVAVLRLITSSNLVGRRKGRSAGFSPLRIRAV